MTLATGQGDLRLESPASPSSAPATLDFLFSDPDASPALGQDPDGAAVLEVIQVWEGAVLGMHHLPAGGAPLTLGGLDETFTAPTDDLPDGSMSLFESAAGAFVVHLRPGWSGFLQRPDGARDPLVADRAAPVVVPPRATAWIDTGHVVFAARHVPPGRRAKGALTDGLDYPFLGILSLVGLCSALFGVALATAPPPAEVSITEVPDRFVQMVLEAPAPKPAPTVRAQATNKPDGAKAKGKEGKVGKKDAHMKRAKGDKVALDRRELDRQIADNAGILGHMDDQGALSGVFGDSALSADLSGSIGGLIGAKGAQMGTNGLASRGGSIGGGGDVESLGGVGTRGRNTGDGRYGEEGGTFSPGKTDGRINQLSGDVITLGALDKSLIDAVVKKHMNSLRYCYQRQLTRDPSIEGKVSVRFVIAGDGSVSKARIKHSSLGSGAVESCLTDTFLRMRFPEPKGNGVVMVTYPFFFSAG